MKSPIKNNLIIELHVPDFYPVKEFYSKLGFKIISEDPKGKYPGYLVMQKEDSLGNTILNFYGDDERVYQQSYFQKFPKETIRGYAVEITIPVLDIENFYKEIYPVISDHIVQELKGKSDGRVNWKDFRLTDPYGFYIRVTELINWGQ